MERKKLPEDVLQDLKCNLCAEYLSYPPITLHSETGSVCGRCPSLEAENNITPLREINYEKIAEKFFLFPCRYHLQGCKAEVSINEMANHEKYCNLKPFFCPIMPLGSCPWLGPPEDSQMHFATEHQEYFLETNMFELDIVNFYAKNELMHSMGSLFIVHQEKSEDDIFFCVIYQINNYNTSKFNYLLEFKSGDGAKKFQVGEKKVPLYTDEISREHGFKVNVPVIRDTLNSPSMITLTIKITEQEITEAIEIEDVAIKEEAKEECLDIQKPKVEDDKMLLDIECPVCQEFMVPPIFQCQTGHSVCGDCKPQLRDCPSCRGPLADTRNFTLEKLTEHIMYQCKNRFEGCTFKANSKEIRNHENFCKFSAIKCPLNGFTECQWKGLNKKLISHLKIEHRDFLITKTDPIVLRLNVDDDNNEIIKVATVFEENFYLRLGANHNKNKFYITCQLVGTPEDAQKFMYETSVIDLKEKMQSIKIKRLCGSVNDKRKTNNHFTTLPLDDVIEQLAENEEMVEVQFRILKV